VIVPGQRHGLVRLAVFAADLLDGLVELVERFAVTLIRHHALGPEYGTYASAASHRVYAMQTARGVEDEVAGR